jgi:GNAT superfamily N-acetyltransferase
MTALPTGYTWRDGANAQAAHTVLTNSYWAKDITLDTVVRSFAGSMQISIWYKDTQVAMARVISDYATFAYLQDVYVLEAHRGKGLSKAMLASLLAHPKLQTIGRWALYTKDAQALYAKFGWREYPWPERMMIIDHKVFPA